MRLLITHERRSGCGNGEASTARKRKKGKEDSASVPEAPPTMNAQVASSSYLGSCAESRGPKIQRKRMKKKRSKVLENDAHSRDLLCDEVSSEKEKQSLLAWVEMCMEPERDGNAVKDSDGGSGNGYSVQERFPGTIRHAHSRAQYGNCNGKVMSLLVPFPHDSMARCNDGVYWNGCSSSGGSLECLDLARDSSEKDPCADNEQSVWRDEIDHDHLHASRTLDVGILRKAVDSQRAGSGSLSPTSKRKRQGDKVLDYVLKRSIVVHDPPKAISFKPRTTKTDVFAWGKSIPVTLTSEALVIEEWISCQNGDLFGLDVEWRPNRAKGQRNKVALLQLSNEQECLIVQMLFLDRQSQALCELLLDPSKGLAGVGVIADGKRLLNDYGLECQGGIELTALAVERLKREELRNVGLKVLVKEVLGLALEKPKRVTLSNWAQAQLDRAQINYACMDAWASFALSKRLLLHT